MLLLTNPTIIMLDESSLGSSSKKPAETFTALIVEQNVHGALMTSDTTIVMAGASPKGLA